MWAHKGRYFADSEPDFAAMARRVYGLVGRRFPADLAVRMLLKPLLLPSWLEGCVQGPLARLAMRVLSA